ncbi:MAG: M28 family peptidase [bacterium]
MYSKVLRVVCVTIVFALAACSSKTVNQAPPKGGIASIDVKDLHDHMAFLASDELQGRETGTHSLDVAARYIATELAKMNLKPVGDHGTFLQHYTLQKQKIAKSSVLAIQKNGEKSEFAFGKQFVSMPSRSMESKTIEGEVVFAGYGIYAPDLEYDSYTGIGAKDKIVVIMGSEPKDANGKSIFDSTKSASQYAQFPTKMQAAMAAGARAMIYVPPPGPEGERMTAQLKQMSGFFARPQFSLANASAPGRGGMNSSMLMMFAMAEVANAILAGSGKTLAELKSEIDAQKKPVPFKLENINAAIRLEIERGETTVSNVMALLEGSDPQLKEEVVVYSAHYDHVGINDDGEIFNGADDDGSGTTALLEIAQAYAEKSERPKRSVLFLWVSGEEKGLLGSRYYSENPIISMEQTIANINMDMVGRVRAADDTSKTNEMLALAKDVYVVGGHQSSDLKKINEQMALQAGLRIDYTLNDLNHPQRIYYRSDHYNFARKGVPVLFYTTGLHEDYHKATDTAEKINFTKIKDIAKMAFLTGWKVANLEKRIVVDNKLELR